MITLVTGGQRSGKSMFAERYALSRSVNPVYLATARIYDEDFKERVRIHQNRRGPEWDVVELPVNVGSARLKEGATVLLDCLTMLATNWFFESDEEVDPALANIEEDLTKLFAQSADFIVVTNEIGLGGISGNELQRKFADLQGKINQWVAAAADEVYFIVSGIPMKIK